MASTCKGVDCHGFKNKTLSMTMLLLRLQIRAAGVKRSRPIISRGACRSFGYDSTNHWTPFGIVERLSIL